MAITQNFAAGTQLAFFSQVDSTGKMTGWNGTRATVAGVAPGMRRFYGIKQANPAPVEPEFPLITGDDGPIGKIEFPPGETPEWIMELAVNDADAKAQLQGTAINNIGQAYFGVFQGANPVYPDICVVYNGKSKNYGVGTKAWQGVIFPVCTAVPLERDAYNERTPAVYRYKLIAQSASKYPWGVTITEALQGDTAAVGFDFQSDNPITLHALVGDGSTTTFSVPVTPVSVAKTVVYVGNGALTALSSVSVANKTITFGSAPANNADIMIMMEFTP